MEEDSLDWRNLWLFSFLFEAWKFPNIWPGECVNYWFLMSVRMDLKEVYICSIQQLIQWIWKWVINRRKLQWPNMYCAKRGGKSNVCLPLLLLASATLIHPIQSLFLYLSIDIFQLFDRITCFYHLGTMSLNLWSHNTFGRKYSSKANGGSDLLSFFPN